MGRFFTIQELTRSSVAIKHGIKNVPNLHQVRNMNALIDAVLDPLRRAYGAPIRVTSGFRSVAVNQLVGGAKNSEHLCNGTSAAADITVGTVAGNRRLFQLCQDLRLPFRQLIDERNYSWIHVSFNPADIRRQVLHL